MSTMRHDPSDERDATREIPVTSGVSADLVDRIVAESEPMMTRMRRVMSTVWQDRSVSKQNLQLLILLDCNGPLPMGQLAALAGVSLPNLTGIVGRMEEHGQVERIHEQRDRRVVVVHLTARGLAAVEEIQTVRRQHLRHILQSLSASEQVVCLQAFQAMSRAAERLDAHETPPPIAEHTAPETLNTTP